MSNTHKNKKVVQKRLAALPSKQKQSSVFSQIREFIYKEDASTDLQKTMDKDLAGAVTDLKSKASDDEFKKVATAGTEDGKPEDEKIPFSTTPVPAAKMFPTQAEIGFGNSLDDICNDKFGAIDSAFSNPVLMPSPDGKVPVMCAEIEGKVAILDGHHRWSLCFMINPTADMSCDIMEPPAGTSAEDALKVMQLAIAANAGNVVTKPFDGKDLMATSTEEVKKYVLENIGEKEVATFAKYNKALNSKEAIAEHIGKSHKLILGMKGPFPRTIMPQAGKSGTSQATVNQSLEKGSINFKEPFTAKESVKRYDTLLKESQTIHRQLTLENNMNKKAHKQLAAIKEWLITGKTLNELTFTSAGIPELIQLIYDKQKELVPKLGFKSMTDILSFIMHGDQEEQAELVDKLQALKVPGSEKLIKEEAAIRQLIRKIIREGEAGSPEEEEETPEPKEEKPEPVEDEPGLDPELVELTDLYVKKLKNAQATIDQTSTSEIISSVLDSFGYGNNDKLSILLAVKNLTVR
jgi:hypothetical protein